MKPRINIVWLKQDVQLLDHAPLYRALVESLPVLLVYCFKDALLEQPIYSKHHWHFVIQGLRDMHHQLLRYHPRSVQVICSSFVDFLQQLQKHVIPCTPVKRQTSNAIRRLANN